MLRFLLALAVSLPLFAAIPISGAGPLSEPAKRIPRAWLAGSSAFSIACADR
jgi:hypothetical protein